MYRWRNLIVSGGMCLAAFSGFSQAAPPPSTARFQFREPRLRAYRLEEKKVATAAVGARNHWLRAWPENGSTNYVELGSRIALQLKPGSDLKRLTDSRPLELARTVAPDFYILQTPDAWTAAREAERLANLPEVLASCPVARRQKQLHSPYALKPNDPYFYQQWHLENRRSDGARAGADLNVRAAWPFTRGEGITIGICDDGFELDHPDLAANAVGAPHFDFINATTNAMPASSQSDHATAVAGLAAAVQGNSIGVSGVAPAARLASLVIFDAFDNIASEEELMDMFQYRSNVVSVQNHSWGNSGIDQLSPSLLEQIAISNAVTFGRDGKGVVIVRSGGNNRGVSGNTDDDGYPSDPRVIAVGAARFDGRAASYSSPGAALLVAAPSGDSDDNFPTIFTTDRQGSLGYNQGTYTNDLANYCFDSTGFSGTSASAPQISGLAALILSANPALTYRDVQQILILSGRHFDLADPDLTTNGAGLRVSHNVGFGLPDAGQAVALAKSWSNRPPATNITLASTEVRAIPDDSLRLRISGSGVPAALSSLRTQPSLGPHADTPTLVLPLVDVGYATNQISQDLTGKAALIQRGPAGDLPDQRNHFDQKIQRAADAGAAFAVVYNHSNTDEIIVMGGTDFVPIPAVFIGQNDGESLVGLLQSNLAVSAQIQLDPASYSFTVTNTLICEHVGVTLVTDHSSRGDLRLTLVSPAGTRSVLQRLNNDTTAGPSGWTYYSTHHFYESSAGTWTAYISDERADNSGSVQSISLTIEGVPIIDTDRDGLDDAWELAHFGTLAFGPREDSDGDGYPNAREQIVGTNPLANDFSLKLDISIWNADYARLSWPSNTNRNYEILIGASAISPMLLRTNLPGAFPEREWFTPTTNLNYQFIRVRSVPPKS